MPQKPVKIGLINPRMEGPYPPLGLGYIAAYLRKYGGHRYDLRIIDGNTSKDIKKEIEAFNPAIVGFTGHSPQILQAVGLSNEIREWRKDIFQIIGGVHASADPAGTLKRGAFDLAVLGEGERTFTEAVDTYIDNGGDRAREIKGAAHRRGDEIIVNHRRAQIEDLDTIPIPARDLFDMDFYLGLSFGVRGLVRSGVTSMTGSRGCPYSCSFCGVGIVFKKVRQFSVEYRIAEISELASRYRARALYFADDTFITNKKSVRAFCESMISSGLNKKVKWTAQARANLMDREDVELLKLMKAAGCIQLEYGFESGSDRVLALLKQNKVTVEDNQRAIDVTRKSGLRVLGTFIVGTPGERMEDLEMTRAFIRKNIDRIDYFQTFICTPFPGSPIYDTCRESGLVEADYFDELEKREKEKGVRVYTDTLPHDLVVETLKELDFMGIKKVSIKDKLVWVLYHLAKADRDASHRDRFYIFKRLIFYFTSLVRPSPGADSKKA
ncbi:MAG: B12-binding domain-containing radical SAM protein [Deltaproteobacteria bacterium]|nr:B12-binding domain-containing radical SAM protein [Deltaproteobacteria bacterium]